MKLPKISKRGYLFAGAIGFAILIPLTGIAFGTGILSAAWATLVLLIAGTANGIMNYKKAQNPAFLTAIVGMAIATVALAILPIAGTLLQTIASYWALFIIPTAIILSAIATYKMVK